jgi:hypothetical protein
MRKYRNYSDEDIIRLSKEVKSIAELLRRLDLKVVGGNYSNIKRNLKRLEVDTSHWLGKAWSKNAQRKDWSNYIVSKSLKKHIIRVRGHRCESCKLEEWVEKPIALEIHHVDGDRTRNESDNLQLLCPNCHAQTENYRKPNFLSEK